MSVEYGREHTSAFWSAINVEYETSYGETKKVHSDSRDRIDESASAIN
jgi:hypothetical protein